MPSWLPLLVALATPPPSVRLEYARLEGAEACPDAVAIAQRITARLGHDPFREPATLVLRLSVERARPGLLARLEVVKEGSAPRKREIASEKGDCAEIVDALTLAATVAIDPFALSRPAAAAAPPLPDPAPPDPPAPAPPPPVAVAPPPPPAEPLEFDAAAATGVGLGLAPSPTIGADLEARLRWRRFSIGLGGRVDIGTPVSLAAAPVSASLLVAAVAPCAHLGPVAGCVLLTAGALRVGATGLDRAEPQSVPFVAAGGRVQLDLPTGSRFFGRLRADLLAPLVRTTLIIDGQAAWSAPPVAGAVSLGLGVRF